MRQITHTQEDLKIVCEDLKAFERRFTEVVSFYQPSTKRWRFILALAFLCTATGAWFWLNDPRTFIVPFLDSFYNHPIFSMAALFLVFLFMYGIHKLVIAPQIITSRMRSVLNDYNMSCDDNGRLILKPRPTSIK